MNYTNAQLKELYKKLPPKVQEAVFSDETAKTLQAIGEQFSLHIDQVGIVADETGLVMLGVTPRSQFASILEKRARVAPDLASKIATEVETRVFKPIQDYMKTSESSDDVDVLPSPEQRTPLTPNLPQYTPPTTTPSPSLPPPMPPAPVSSTPPETTTSTTTPSSTPVTPPAGSTQNNDLSMIGSKLGGVTYGSIKNKEETQPDTQKPGGAGYSVDPYREPIG